MTWACVQQTVEQALGTTFPAVVLEVRRAGKVVFAGAWGYLDPDADREPARGDTRFDLASVTKLFALTVLMSFAECGALALDQPVREVLPEFNGQRPLRPYEDPLHPGKFVEVVSPTDSCADAGRVTFRHLLAHHSGLPAWRPLYQEPSAAAARQMALRTHFSSPIGVRVVYSDIGFILLGLALERLAHQPLDRILDERVLSPLHLSATGYKPRSPDACAPTEICAWRGRRLRGEVDDENAARLDGVSGHAGLFATVSDVAALGQMYLAGGQSNLNAATVAEMTRLQAEDGAVRRGLGFALWSSDPESSGNPFSPRAFGHNGFTGTSLWIDPARELVVACLTNRVYYGRDPRGITSFRVALHRAVVDAVDQDMGRKGKGI